MSEYKTEEFHINGEELREDQRVDPSRQYPPDHYQEP